MLQFPGIWYSQVSPHLQTPQMSTPSTHVYQSPGSGFQAVGWRLLVILPRQHRYLQPIDVGLCIMAVYTNMDTSELVNADVN